MPVHRKQAVGVIRRGGEHLLGLIEGTLDIARIESGKLALDPPPLRLHEALQQIVQMFELQALSKGLRFEHDIEGAPALVRADERRLTQILINVLGNAVKFTQAGRVSFRAAARARHGGVRDRGHRPGHRGARPGNASSSPSRAAAMRPVARQRARAARAWA